jgi:hypothetical protein
MADPNAFEHPVSTTNRIDPAQVTENAAVNWTLAAVSGIKPGQLPPPLVPGFTPLDVQRMAGFGTPARSFFDQQFLQMSDPISRGLFGSVQDPGLRDLRRYYEGSALQQQVLSHPSAQFVLGGNPYGGFQNMMNASEYLARGTLPLNETMYQRSRFGAMQQMAGLGHTMMTDIYGMQGGTASMTPNLAVTRGFRAEDPFLLGAQLAARDRFMVPDETRPGAMRRAQNNQERASVVGANLDMLSAGRNVFGDMPAMDMLANVERMMGTDPTANPREFRQRLTKFAALAAAVGENAQALVEVQQQMLAGLGGGVGGGGGMGYGGRAIGGIMGTLGGTIPMTSHGASVGGWVEATALTATQEYANILGGRRVFGGDLSAGGKEDVLMNVMARQQIREASGIGKASRMIRLMESENLVSPELVVRYEEAQRGGDRHAVGRVLRDLSTEYSQDPNYLGNVLRNEAQYNDFISRHAQAAGPARTMRAQTAAAGDVKNIERGELVERVTRDRAQRGYRGALRLFRAADLTPDLKAADEAGYVAMQEALQTEGGLLQGISKEDRAAMADQLNLWHSNKMPMREMMGSMQRSKLFRDTHGAENLSLAAAAGINLNLQNQLLTANEGDAVSFQSQAQEVWTSAGRNPAAAAARTEVNRLWRTGKHFDAQEKLAEFINSPESGFSDEMRVSLRKRLRAIQASTTQQVWTVAQGGTGAMMEKGPLAGAGQDVLSAMGGTQPVNALLESYRAYATGVAKDLESTSGPGGAAYRDVQGAELRLRQTPDTSRLAAEAVTQKVQETVGKATTKAPDGSDRPIRVTIVEDERQQPPAPIESGQRWTTWEVLFGGPGRQPKQRR